MCDKQSLFTIKSTISVPSLINAYNSSSYRRQVSVVHNNHNETIISLTIFDLFPFSKQIENYPKIVITRTIDKIGLKTLADDIKSDTHNCKKEMAL